MSNIQLIKYICEHPYYEKIFLGGLHEKTPINAVLFLSNLIIADVNNNWIIDTSERKTLFAYYN